MQSYPIQSSIYGAQFDQYYDQTIGVICHHDNDESISQKEASVSRIIAELSCLKELPSLRYDLIERYQNMSWDSNSINKIRTELALTKIHILFQRAFGKSLPSNGQLSLMDQSHLTMIMPSQTLFVSNIMVGMSLASLATYLGVQLAPPADDLTLFSDMLLSEDQIILNPQSNEPSIVPLADFSQQTEIVESFKKLDPNQFKLEDKNKQNWVGKYFPQGFKAISLNTNKSSSLTGNSKKHKVVVFWATWCGPCTKERPYLESIAAQFRDELDVITVSIDEDKSKLDKYLNKRESSKIKDFWDEGLSIKQNLNLRSVPLILILDHDNKILEHPKSIQESDIDEAIKKTLAT